MKKLAFLFLLLLLTTRLFAQEGDQLVAFCKNFDYQDLEKGLAGFKEKSNEAIHFRHYSILDRELVNGFFERVIHFKKAIRKSKDPDVYTIYSFSIQLITYQSEKIAYYRIIQPTRKRVGDSWVNEEILIGEGQNEFINALKIDFLNTYNASISITQLFDNSVTFGYHCGRAGMSPTYRIKMNELVAAKDTTTLLNWLSSTTVELQLYAMDGILTLKKEGLVFDQKVFDLIDLVANKEGDAITCTGCLHGTSSIKRAATGIRQKHEE